MLAAAPSMYVLSRTVDRTIRLKSWEVAAHYGVEVAIQAAKVAAVWHWVGPGAAAAALLWEAPRVPFSIMGQSALHLTIRYVIQKLRFLRELAREPGVHKIQVIRGSTPKLEGFVVREQENSAFVALESNQPLEGRDIVIKRPSGRLLGQRIEEHFQAIPAPKEMVVRVNFGIADGTHAVAWKTTLPEFLARPPQPSDIAAVWRSWFEELRSLESWWRRLAMSRVKKRTHMDITLELPSGSTVDLGTLAKGRAAARLLRGNKSMPVSETRVSKFWSRRGLKRWIDVLLGREIVVK
jgi:hypothetical protein